MIYLYITKILLLMSGEERGDDKREKRRTVSKRLHAFPGGSVVKNLPANAGDTGLFPGLGRSHMMQNHQTHARQLLSLESRSHNYWSPCICSPCFSIRKATTVRSSRTATKNSFHLQQLEKKKSWKTQHNQKSTLKKLFAVVPVGKDGGLGEGVGIEGGRYGLGPIWGWVMDWIADGRVDGVLI